MKQSSTDYTIPRISFKSSLVISVGAFLGCIVIPLLMQFIGLDYKIGVVIGSATIVAYALTYTRYFIDTKRGYCKKFLRTYLLFAISFAIISFFWLYLDTFL